MDSIYLESVNYKEIWIVQILKCNVLIEDCIFQLYFFLNFDRTNQTFDFFKISEYSNNSFAKSNSIEKTILI